MQSLRLGFARPAETAQDFGDSVALAVELGPADGNVLGGVVPAAQSAPSLGPRCDGQCRWIFADQLELGLQAPDRGLRVSLSSQPA